MTSLDDLQALMAARIEAAGLDEAGARIPPRADRHRAELSFAQRRIWMHQQLYPDSVAYNVCLCLYFTGTVDDDALATAFETLAHQNEALRTTFHDENGSLHQRIHEAMPLIIDRTDLAHLNADASAGAVQALAYTQARTPFDLSLEAPMRVTFVRTAADSVTVILTVQHIAWDGMTFAALSRSVERTYRQLVSGRQSVNGHVPTTQVADHADWEQSHFRRLDDTEQFRFWEGQLQPEPPPLMLPTDKPAPPVLSERGARVDRRMDPRCAQGLTALSTRLGTTPYTVFLTTYYLLLSRFSGSTDVTVGTAVANRDDPGLEDLIGNFGNTLALRADLQMNNSFAQTVHQVQAITEAAFAHQDYPFDRIVERLNPIRALGQPVFFQAMLLFLTQDIEGPQLPGCSTGWTRVDNHSAQLPLALEVFLRDGQMDVEATYATDLFDAQTITRMLDYLEELLVAIGDEPQAPIRQLMGLTTRDRALIDQWSQGDPESESTTPPCARVDDLIAEQACATPGYIAIRVGEKSLTYRDFDVRVNQLARHLIGLGTRVGDRVVVMLSRDEALPIALAAVGRAGAAYVPIDVTYPGERVAYLIRDSDPVVVLTDSQVAEQHSATLQATRERGRVVIEVDDPGLSVALGAHPGTTVQAAERDRTIHRNDPALLIYTSGSTGDPKGVLISQSAIASRLRWQAGRSGPGGVFLAKSAIGFIDASTEFLGALTRGGTVVVADAETAHDPQLLIKQISRHEVTDLVTVPALAHALATTPGAAEHLSSIRRWICSGETFTGATLAALHRVVPDAQIVNFYGSTEITGDATAVIAAEPGAESETTYGTVAIGSPVAGTAAYVLDRFLRPAPPGVTGELYVAGAQVATGYHNRAALTAERFVANPLRASADHRHSSRLYRTGDLARWNHSGQLEYLGRTDHQVKLRGFRIELDEIQVALEAHPDVRSAVATTFRRDPDDEMSTYLVAYHTPTTGTSSTEPSLSAALRDHMSRLLPQHMVPTVFVALDRLPTNAHGKIDKNSLLPPDLNDGRPVEQEPRTDTERRVADAFRDVLSLPAARSLDIDDNFFHLGGHSLSATRLVTQLNTALGSGVTMRSVFEAPTIALLASEVDRLTSSSPQAPDATTPPDQIVATPRSGNSVLSAAQERLWFFHQVTGPTSVYNIALAFRIHGPVASAALTSALKDLVSRHEVLRTRFDDTERRGVVQNVLAADDVDVQFTQTTESDVCVQEFLSEQSTYCFELDRELPIRAALISLHAGGYILSITVHHIAFDQWSGPILFADLERAYRSRTAGRAPDWDQLPIHYADYAAWQRLSMGTVESPTISAQSQLEYWQGKLTGIPDEIPLPTDRMRPAVSDYRGACITLTLPSCQLRALKDTCRRLQVTEYMAANTAVAIALNLNGSGLDIPVGTPISGRGHPAISDLIGFFVNTLVIRNDLSGDHTLTEMLSRVRRDLLDAFDNQALPFERLVDALNPERSMARHPLFQTMAVYRTATAPLRFDDYDAEFVPSPVSTSKFDLEFEFQESLDQDLTINLIFATELFNEATAHRLLDTVVRVLTTIADDPAQRISQLTTVSPGDEQQLRQWSSAGTEPAPAQTLDRLLTRRCEQTPDRIAINLGTNAWTYRDLSAARNRLARSLISRGIGAGNRVAIMAPRSPELIVAITGVLTTGAAYVPVDPAYPSDRIAYLLTDSTPSLVLVMNEADRSTAKELTDVAVVTLEESITRHRADNPTSDLPLTPQELVRPHGPTDTAYVMYTSGSTGTPKGVIINHANIVALFSATSSMTFTDRDVWTLFHSYSFDFSVWEIWGALLHGGRLVVVDQDTARDPSRFGQLLRDEQVTVLSQTPSAFYSLIHSEEDRPGGPPEALRTIVFGGEALDYRKIADWRKRHPDSEVGLFNMFGITETTVHTTIHPISIDEGSAASVIGRPLPNLSTYVLDEYLRPTPPGVTGELYVAGPQVAEGYFNRPALSASRFIANPFQDTNPALRLYRTGDLARWSTAGTLEYRGRADQQVKIRGFRIELDEIRAAMDSHPSLSRAAVIACERDAMGAAGQYLVGYWVAADSAPTAISASELRTHLQSVLPAHMVPAHLVEIPAIPMTANGKLDRRALPEPAPDTGHADGRAPASAVEQSLVSVYTDVLGLPGVTPDDDFFHLGGDSISALALVRRARVLGIVITPPDVFNHRTVAALAGIAGTVEPEDQATSTALPSPVHRPTSLTPIMHRQLGGGVDQSALRHTLLLVAPPDLDLDRLERALRAVIDQHAALSLSIGRTGETPTIEHAPRDLRAPLVHRFDATAQTDSAMGEYIQHVEAELAGGLDLSSGQLTHIAHFDRGDEPGVLAWTVNHFAVDYVSWDILTADLQSAYEGSDDTIPTTDLAFFTWLELLNSPAQLEVFRRDAKHWIAELNAAAPLNATTDPTPVAEQQVLRVTLPHALSARLVSEPPRLGSSTNNVLLAGLAVALQRWRATRSMPATPGLLIDVEGHGRSASLAGPALETTVGWFTTVRPVAVRVSTDDATAITGSSLPDLDCVVAANAAMEAIPNDGISYGALRHLDPESMTLFAELSNADVQFNYGGIVTASAHHQVSAWTTPHFLPRLIATTPALTPLSHALTVDIVGQRSSQHTEIGFSFTGDRTFTAESLQELAAGFEAVLESISQTLTALPENTSLADRLTPQAVSPMANQHRLRLSGIPLDRFVLTEVVDLDGRDDLDLQRLELAVYSVISQQDSLRQRLVAKNRLLWTMEVIEPSAHQTQAMSSVHHLPQQTRQDALDTVADHMREQIDALAGRTLHISVVESAVGRHLMVAIHGAVADRSSVHLVTQSIVSALESGAIARGRSEASITEIAAVLESRAQSTEAEAALERISRVCVDRPVAVLQQVRTTSVACASLPGSFGRSDIEQAFCQAYAVATGTARTTIDVEVDQRDFLSADLRTDHKIGWLTTTYPRGTDLTLESADRHWYSLVRYNNRRGRRLLKTAGNPLVLLTQTFGHQANPAQAEGVECYYSVIGRYRLNHNSIDLEVLAAEAGAAEAIAGAWSHELSRKSEQIS